MVALSSETQAIPTIKEGRGLGKGRHQNSARLSSPSILNNQNLPEVASMLCMSRSVFGEDTTLFLSTFLFFPVAGLPFVKKNASLVVIGHGFAIDGGFIGT